MDVEWNSRRFSSGALALDVANTVIYRNDLLKRHDRLASLEEANRFAAAALAHGAAEINGQGGFHPMRQSEFGTLLSLRESIYQYFGLESFNSELSLPRLSSLLIECGTSLRKRARPALAAQTALSAVGLLPAGRQGRVRACPSCHWLFVDRSKNSSRIWCDMSVCGNQQKVKRHNLRRRAAGLASATQ